MDLNPTFHVRRAIKVENDTTIKSCNVMDAAPEAPGRDLLSI
jgi:hypothetical protein